MGVLDWERPLLSVVPDDAPDASLDIDELGSRIIGLAGRLASATCRWLLLVAGFDQRTGYEHFGLTSTARWLSHYCSLSRRTARDHVRVARSLAGHERLRTEMSAGRLSYSQVRAISRVAELGDEQLVDELIIVAEHGTVRHLEDVVRGLRSVDDIEQPTPPSDRERVTHRWRSDSLMGFSARLDPENGALLRAAIDAVARNEGITHAQALTRMAEIALATIGADGEAPSLLGPELAAIQIHVDAGRVVPDTGAEPASSGGRIVGGPGLPQRVLERLLCSGRVRTAVLGRGGRPLDLGRNNRVVSQRVFAALLLRDGGCGHPGCDSRIGLEAHHVKHWLHGGRTVMDNLVLLCRRHHHALHDERFDIVALGQGRFRFRRPDGRTLPAVVDPARYSESRRPLEGEHAHVAAGAASCGWNGDLLDLDYAVAVLAPGLRTVGRRTARPDPWAATRPDPWAATRPDPWAAA
jgi:hypothetical protein